MAQNSHQISTARFLLDHRADIRPTNTKGATPFDTMARGPLVDRPHRDGMYEMVTIGDMIRAQDEMASALVEAAGRDTTVIMMSQPNLAGETPQQLL